MKKLIIIPVILTFAACGGNEETKQKIQTGVTVQNIELGETGQSDSVTMTQVVSNQFDLNVVASNPRLKVEPKRDGSVLTTLTAQYRLPMPGMISPNLSAVTPVIQMPNAQTCKLEVTQFTQPDANGNTQMTLSGSDESSDQRVCTSFLAEIYHSGARFHFVNVPATGYADGTHLIEVNLTAKPY